MRLTLAERLSQWQVDPLAPKEPPLAAIVSALLTERCVAAITQRFIHPAECFTILDCYILADQVHQSIDTLLSVHLTRCTIEGDDAHIALDLFFGCAWRDDDVAFTFKSSCFAGAPAAH